MTDSIEEEYVSKCPRCKAPAHACGHWKACLCGMFNAKPNATCVGCGASFSIVEEFLNSPLASAAKVYCVICMDGDHARDLVHVFSTQDLAQAFADKDTDRRHVLYDYVIDCPERMEGRTQ